MLAKYAAIGLTLSLLAACVGPQRVRDGWPVEAPPIHYFEQVYADDPENQTQQTLDNYLLWVKNFYVGWGLYRQGWNDLVPSVLESFDDPEMAREVAKQLYSLGREIGGEWGKYREVRRIKSRHLSIWANAVQKAMVEDKVREIIAKIERDVEELLSERLAIGDIQGSRYFPQDEDDVFRL